jgi:Mn-dependent DtxR family transcriptional regulator
MANKTIRDSLERVDKYLQEKKEFVVITQIAKDLNLQFSSIKKCVETLQNFDRVEVATNGNIILVKSKGEIQNATA